MLYRPQMGTPLPPFPPLPPPNSRTNSRKSEPGWHLKYLITINFCAKYLPNRLTTTLAPGTLSQTGTLDTQSSSFQSRVLLRTRSREYTEKGTAYNELATVHNEKSTLCSGNIIAQNATNTAYKEESTAYDTKCTA